MDEDTGCSADPQVDSATESDDALTGGSRVLGKRRRAQAGMGSETRSGPRRQPRAAARKTSYKDWTSSDDDEDSTEESQDDNDYADVGRARSREADPAEEVKKPEAILGHKLLSDEGTDMCLPTGYRVVEEAGDDKGLCARRFSFLLDTSVSNSAFRRWKRAADLVERAKRDSSLAATFTQYFLVKWRGVSHIHCEWISHAHLEATGIGGIKRIRNYERAQEVKWRKLILKEAQKADAQGAKAAAASGSRPGDAEAVIQARISSSVGGGSLVSKAAPDMAMDTATDTTTKMTVDASTESKEMTKCNAEPNGKTKPENATDESKSDIRGSNSDASQCAQDDSTPAAQQGEATLRRVPCFNPEFCRVDRILAHVKTDGEMRFFVKWASLGYSECTWETQSDISQNVQDGTLAMRRYAQRVLANRQRLREASSPNPTTPKPNNIPFAEEKRGEIDLSFSPAGLKLRQYQTQGVQWLALNWHANRNSILADEMGLGKTVQVVSFLAYLRERRAVPGPFLVVVPKSTMAFWRREIERFSRLRCVLYGGTRKARDQVRKHDWTLSLDHCRYLSSLSQLIQSSQDVGEKDSSGRDSSSSTDAKLTSPQPTQTPTHTPSISITPATDGTKTHGTKTHGTKTHGKPRRLYKFDVLVVSYAIAIKDSTTLLGVDWSCVVVDEAQRLKNEKSELYLKLDRFPCRRRVLSTGTPIQNTMDELWALLHFINRKQFPTKSREEFMSKFGNLDSVRKVEAIYAILAPCMLRRMKADVEKNLPAKEEVIVSVELTSAQKKYYKAVFERNLRKLNFSKRRAIASNSLLNVAMQLRKVCCHPYLMLGVEQEEAAECKTHEEVMLQLIRCSGKFVLLDKLLAKLKKEGHRVLIFSQMTRLLDILQDYLEFRNYSWERLDGSTRGPDRQAAIDRFNAEGSDAFCFMLSTKAGGTGITLTSADTCILFDSDWNLQNDIQAQARCHRIGQTRSVVTYRLLTNGTYEMEMFRRACRKLSLDQTVLHTITTDAGAQSMALDLARGQKRSKSTDLDKQEIERMLKTGAYNVFVDDEGGNARAKAFAEADIDHILKRSEKIRYTTAKQSGGMFSRAKFVPEGSDRAIDFTDPDFWSKIGLEEEKEKLPIVHTKRTRKARKLFTFPDASADRKGTESVSDFSQDEEEAAQSKPEVTKAKMSPHTKTKRPSRRIKRLKFEERKPLELLLRQRQRVDGHAARRITRKVLRGFVGRWAPSAVAVFVSSLGLPQVGSLFLRERVDGSQLMTVTDTQLRNLGLSNEAERRAVLAARAYLNTPPLTWSLKGYGPLLHAYDEIFQRQLDDAGADDDWSELPEEDRTGKPKKEIQPTKEVKIVKMEIEPRDSGPRDSGPRDSEPIDKQIMNKECADEKTADADDGEQPAHGSGTSMDIDGAQPIEQGDSTPMEAQNV